MRVPQLSLFVLVLVAGSACHGGSAPPAVSAKSPTSQSAVLTVALAAQLARGNATAHEVFTALLGPAIESPESDALADCLRAVPAGQNGSVTKLLRSRLINWMSVGGTQPDDATLSPLLHAAVPRLLVRTDDVGARTRASVGRLLARLGNWDETPTLDEVVATPAFIELVLPQEFYGNEGADLLRAAARPEDLFAHATGLLAAATAELNLALEAHAAGSTAVEIAPRRARLALVANTSAALMSRYSEDAADYLRICAQVPLAYSRISTSLGGQVGAGRTASTFAGGSTDSWYDPFTDFTDEVGEAFEDATSWTIEKLKDLGDWLIEHDIEITVECEEAGQEYICSLIINDVTLPLPQFKGGLETSLGQLEQRLLDIEDEVAQTARLVANLDDRLSEIVDRITTSKQEILDAIRIMEAGFAAGQQQVLGAVADANAHLLRAREELRDLRELVVFFYQETVQDSIDAAVRDFDGLVAQALVAAGSGDSPTLRQLVADLKSRVEDMPRSVMLNDIFVSSVPDLMLRLENHAVTPDYRALEAYAGGLNSISEVLTSRAAGPLMNPSGMHYLASRLLEVLRAAEVSAPGAFVADLAWLRSQLASARQDQRLSLADYLTTSLARAAGSAPHAGEEIAAVDRVARAACTPPLPTEGPAGLLAWLRSNEMVDSAEVVRLPLASLPLPELKPTAAGPGHFVYRYSGSDVMADGVDPFLVLAQAGAITFTAQGQPQQQWLRARVNVRQAVRGVNSQLDALHGRQLCRLRFSLAPAVIEVDPSTVPGGLAGLHSECRDILAALSAVIMHTFVLPAFEQHGPWQHLGDTGGALAAVRFGLVHTLGLVRGDSERESHIRDTLGGPMMTSLRLFSLGHRNVAIEEIMPTALTDHVRQIMATGERVATIASMVEQIDLQVEQLRQSLENGLLQDLQAGTFYSAPFDEVTERSLLLR